MTKKQLEDFIRNNPRRAFALCIPLAAMIVAVPISCDMRAEQYKKEQQARIATEEAEETARQEKLKSKWAEEAASKGMSVEDYIKARDIFEFKAYIDCSLAVEKQAQWGAKTDLIRKAGWTIRKDGTMLIRGRDIRMKNAFNAERYVEYTCVYDMQKNTLKVLSID
ncbi:MAG: hypothetical protein ACKVOE_08820 [Rickettsiales bacterium]